jgi:thymidylate synthase
MSRINIIIASDSEYGIASSETPGLPWPYFKEDMIRFKKLTIGNGSIGNESICNGSIGNESIGNGSIGNESIILMGRKTADTFKKPLSSRINMVLTSQTDYRKSEGFITVNTYLDFIEYINMPINRNKIVSIIGGAELIKEAMKYPKYINIVYLTYIHYYKHHTNNTLHYHDETTDIYLPESFIKLINRSPYTYEHFPQDSIFTGTFRIYTIQPDAEQKISKGEQQYLNQLYELTQSPLRETRNGNVYGVFSRQLIFDLSDGFPALTTKKLFWKGVVGELLFFLQGKTQTNELAENGINIWKGNTSKTFLAKMGFDYEEGEMGPMYGYIWRFAGSTCFDQLKMVLDLLHTDPMSRRIMMTTYDPSIANKGVLYPCHGIITQYYVHSYKNNDGKQIYKVDCKTYQRSADWFLGVPFNIASYGLLLHMIVNHLTQLTGIEYIAGTLYMDFGDVHLYESHMKPAFNQLGQYGFSLPTLEITKPVDLLDPEFYKNVTFEDFKLNGYRSGKIIQAPFVP